MIKTIIIDDEQGCLETLDILLQRYCPEIDLIASHSNPHQGLEAILSLHPDLVLLDIEMPELSGFDILEKIRGIVAPDVIFTTAHNEYAVKAFKYAAVHYLLKPIDALDLQAAVARCKAQSANANKSLLDLLLQNHRKIGAESPTLALPTMDGFIFIQPDEILRCEAHGSYTRFYLKGKESVIVSRTLGDYEDILADNRCYRVHDKNIVNLRYVKKYLKGEGGQVVLTDDSVVDVSRRRKEGFLEKMARV